MSFAENLKAARKRLAITQKRLAEIAGVSCNTIINYENGRRTDPPISVAMKLAGALGVSVESLAMHDLKEKNAAKLLEQFGGETIEDFQREVLKAAVSKKFSADLVGTAQDKRGNAFVYFVDARGILDVFLSSPLSGVHIEKLVGSETVALAYGRLKLEQLGVLTEDEIELLCQHIHAAGIL